MAQAKESKIPTFTAGEALEQYRRVKIENGTTTVPPEVVYADAGEQAIGYTTQAVADGCLVSVKTINYPGTRIAIASEAFAVDATLYAAADGKVADTASGFAVGKAVQAATADADEVEIIDFAVASTTAATTSIADAGGFTSETDVEGVTQEIYQDLFSAQCFIPLPLTTFQESDGTNTVAYLSTGTTPTLDLLNGDTDSCLALTWVASNNDAIITSTPLPPDLDVTADLIVHFRGKSGGATDTPVFALDTYFNEGDTKVEDNSAALTASYAEFIATIAAADVPAGAQTITIEITPGAHTTDTAILTAIWLEYTRTIRTS